MERGRSTTKSESQITRLWPTSSHTHTHRAGLTYASAAIVHTMAVQVAGTEFSRPSPAVLPTSLRAMAAAAAAPGVSVRVRRTSFSQAMRLPLSSVRAAGGAACACACGGAWWRASHQLVMRWWCAYCDAPLPARAHTQNLRPNDMFITKGSRACATRVVGTNAHSLARRARRRSAMGTACGACAALTAVCFVARCAGMRACALCA